MSDPTTATPVAISPECEVPGVLTRRVRAALTRAGITDWEVLTAAPTETVLVSSRTAEHLGPLVFEIEADVLIMRTDPRDSERTYRIDGLYRHEEHTAALVRACMAGSWKAEIAEQLGILPTVDAMLAYSANRGWWPDVSAVLDKGAADTYGRPVRWFGSTRMCLPVECASEPAEALARAVLRSVDHFGVSDE
jgi:hypothetical protein